MLLSPSVMSADEHYSHHVAVVTGWSWHGNEEAVYLGADYVYNFANRVTLGAFIEGVSGDYELQAVGIMLGRTFANGFKFSVGPGVEYKVKKDQTLGLFRATLAYDWHIGRWSVGPTVSHDWIEDASDTTYAGLAVGYSF